MKTNLKILPALSPTFSGPNMLLNSLSGEKKLKSSALPLSRGLEHKYYGKIETSSWYCSVTTV